MPSRPSVSVRRRLAALPLLTATALAMPAPGAGAASPFTLAVVERSVAQDEVLQDRAQPDPRRTWQAWQVDYRLRLDGPTALVVAPEEIAAEVQGWVSNSRVPSHAVPRWSALAVSGASGLSATAEIVPAGDDAERCRERATLQVWVGDGPAPEPKPADRGSKFRRDDDDDDEPEARPSLSLAPGDLVNVRLRLVHQHFLYGAYDPLLGRRALALRLGAAALRDDLPLDREHRVARPSMAWTPPDERRDTRQFVSPPDSLHLRAHVPGDHDYRLPEQPVRYATPMRLRFWYLVAPGTEGPCKARVAQYKDYKVLPEGAFEEVLATVGRWTYVERIFRTEPEATSLDLDFRIVGTEVGELWIDDVALEPADTAPQGP